MCLCVHVCVYLCVRGGKTAKDVAAAFVEQVFMLTHTGTGAHTDNDEATHTHTHCCVQLRSRSGNSLAEDLNK